ncbi:MAG: SPOR domain-containing protein [Candidatus Omnitrophica bacterium]|nr:SPOR domain-containing protein [Candidatus Omnitrophota bacterium]
MDINYKQDQFELFPGVSPGSSGPQPQPRLFFSSITLSGENIIVLTVFIFLAIIVSFSFGVENGKRFVIHSGPMAGQIAIQKPQVVQKLHVDQRPVIAQRPTMIQAPRTTVAQPQKVSPRMIQSTVVAKKSAPVPAPKADVALPAVSGGFYTVQIASFKKQEFAEQEAHGLKKKGYETFIVPKGQHLILCAGRFLDQGGAKVLSGKLRNQYKDCLVRRL